MRRREQRNRLEAYSTLLFGASSGVPRTTCRDHCSPWHRRDGASSSQYLRDLRAKISFSQLANPLPSMQKNSEKFQSEEFSRLLPVEEI
jgi:hypothetical protein